MRLKREVLTAIVAERFAARGVDARPDRPLVLRAAGPAPAEIRLDALWASACRDADWSAEIEPFVRSTRRRLIVLERSPERLVPVLRRSADVADLIAHAVLAPFASGVTAALTLEDDAVSSFVLASDLLRWALTPAQALRSAQRLLNARTVPFSLAPHARDRRVLRVVARDHLAAARLLIGDWTAFAARLGGPMFAAIPAEDALLLTGDPAAVAALGEIARAAHARATLPLTPEVLSWTGDGFASISA